MLFSEHTFIQKNAQVGSIEVICGSMFSGKTEELIRRLKRAKIANLKVEIFKPAMDVRYDEIKIVSQFAKLPVEIFKPAIDIRYDERAVVSHNSNSIPSTPISHSSAILLLRADTKVVGIDEAQFFDEELPNVCV